MHSRKHVFLPLISAVIALSANAEVMLPHLISDGMVVQRGRPVVLWGKAEPGETVSVKIKKGKSAKTVAGEDGKWRVELPALKAGGPYSISINDKTIENVMSGDVILCSGQSNMELPVSRVTDMFADEISSYQNPDIRHFKVPNVYNFHGPQDDVVSSWKSLDKNNVMNFSALAYFTAKAINREEGVPVGIINSSWGGTPVEAWISEEYLEKYPLALNKKSIYEDDSYRDRIKKLEGENFARWNAVLYKNDPGLHGEPWYSPDLDDSSWKEVILPVGGVNDRTTDSMSAAKEADRSENWATDGLNSINGSHWFRKSFVVSESQAGKPGVIRLGCIVDADSVFVNGKFVGTTGYQYPPRIYNIPEGLLHKGENNVTVRVISQNGKAHFVPDKPYCVIIGNERIPLSGVWKYKTGTPMPQAPGMKFYCYEPTVLYNAMISPVVNYPVKGVVWYQGESNVSRRNEYSDLLKTMIENWRNSKNDKDLPFYIVELADYLHPSDKGGRQAWADFRIQQAKTAEETDRAYLIRNSDLGEWNDIHPLDKKTLGERVAKAIIENGIIADK